MNAPTSVRPAGSRQAWFRFWALAGALSIGGALSWLLWPALERSEAHRQVVRFAAQRGIPLVDLTQLKQRFEPPEGVHTVPWFWLVRGHDSATSSARELYRGDSWVRNVYRYNPRGYLHTMTPAEMAQSLWRLDAVDGCPIERAFLTDEGQVVTRIQHGAGTAAEPQSVWLESELLSLPARGPTQLRFRARSSAPRPITVLLRPAARPLDAGTRTETIELGPDWQEFQFDAQAGDLSEGFRWTLWLGGAEGDLELSEIGLLGLEEKPLSLPELPYYIDVRFNAAGNRDLPRTVEKPVGVFRIGCLGDSYTWGAGVHFDDLFTRQLEPLLNRDPPRPGLRYEVLNFGVAGSAPGEELRKFVERDQAFDLDLVLVTLCYNDNLERAQTVDLVRQYQGPPAQTWNWVMEAARRQGFDNCLDALAQIEAVCHERGIPLAVATFQNFDSADWEQLDVEVGPELARRGVPYFNAREALVAAGVWGPEALAMQQFDNHPSAAAHRAYAQALAEFFDRQRLLEPARDDVARPPGLGPTAD